MNLVLRDPVCGMQSREDSPHQAEYHGTRYFFCSAGCREEFLRTPDAFLSGAASDSAPAHEASRPWRDYLPLFIILALTALCATVRQFPLGHWSGMVWMHEFMGLFLVLFSMFKFFDLPGFADGFSRYDLLAGSFRPYALLYPFLELGLGLGYLSFWHARAIYLGTVVLMGFGSLGVLRSVGQRQQLQCACLGTVLKVPLTTVAVVEDLGMAAMAAAMLWTSR